MRLIPTLFESARAKEKEILSFSSFIFLFPLLPSSPSFYLHFFHSSSSSSLYERPIYKERRAMKNTIRCCISCILPCGALDVIRIVHSNGRVEEISGSITASEIMKAHPKHVLKKPSSSSDDGMVPKIVIVPPDAELQRGKIYFLMPDPSTPEKTRSKSSSTTKKKRRDSLEFDSSSNSSRQHRHSRSMSNANKNNNTISVTNLLISDQYLSEILSEKLSTQRDRRRGRVGVWRPHLESISETPNEC